MGGGAGALPPSSPPLGEEEEEVGMRGRMKGEKECKFSVINELYRPMRRTGYL